MDVTLLITNGFHGLLQRTKQKLCSEFDMTDSGPIESTTLGLQVLYNQHHQSIKIFQEQYINSLLMKFKMETCNPTSIPMEPSQKMTKVDSPQTNEEFLDMNNIPYKTLVGSLMHDVCISTRLDISFSTNSVAQFLSNPGKKH